MELKIDNDIRKMRIINYLDYMDDKSLQEIAAALYNLSKKRQENRNSERMQDESEK
ncbi:hypothetical protein HOM13_01185 [Candidatus Woesearchaeota archaeon]|jgi:hypothetical protein|nr:hypothetical protein [Candidatus Woesearchaeota archaeon]MBT6049882.1 hypothetical protein [Candidatus Scalindua sp.]